MENVDISKLINSERSTVFLFVLASLLSKTQPMGCYPPDREVTDKPLTARKRPFFIVNIQFKNRKNPFIIPVYKLSFFLQINNATLNSQMISVTANKQSPSFLYFLYSLSPMTLLTVFLFYLLQQYFFVMIKSRSIVSEDISGNQTVVYLLYIENLLNELLCVSFTAPTHLR